MSRSAHTPAAITGHWIRPSTRWAIYLRDGFSCVYCTTVGTLTLDHLRSVERHGRDNAPSNLLTTCRSCNSSKKSLSSRAWYRKLRLEGFNILVIQRRVARAIRTPIDRDRGRFLAEQVARHHPDMVEPAEDLDGR